MSSTCNSPSERATLPNSLSFSVCVYRYIYSAAVFCLTAFIMYIQCQACLSRLRPVSFPSFLDSSCLPDWPRFFSLSSMHKKIRMVEPTLFGHYVILLLLYELYIQDIDLHLKKMGSIGYWCDTELRLEQHIHIMIRLRIQISQHSLRKILFGNKHPTLI